MEAFYTIIGDNLDFIRNSQGQTLRKIGPNWVNGIGDCQPGKGYLIKMFSDDILFYPDFVKCGEPFTDLRDGQTYNTVQVGGQCWMAENLNIGIEIDSTEDMTNNGIIEKVCYDYNSENCIEYGGLYKWDEMMQYTTMQGAQGICPDGWYIPTKDECLSLIDLFGGNSVAGGEMKEAGTLHWQAPNTGATNNSGLTILPGGYRYYNGVFYALNGYGFFWTSTEIGTWGAYYPTLYYDLGAIGGENGSKNFCINVRCIKDNSNFSKSSGGKDNRHIDLQSKKTKNSEAVHFNFKSGNPAEAVYTLYIKGLEIGDEVAAYDGDKLVGAVKINSENAFENELPVFSTLTNGIGYEEGNPITFKVWSENNIVSADFTMEATYDSYVSDVYPDGDGKYSVVNITKGSIEIIEESISVYPNPSKGIFNISFEGIKSDIQIKVLDLRGKEYSNFIFSGSASTRLDLTELAAGVYFLSFSGKDFSEVKKIVIK